MTNPFFSIVIPTFDRPLNLEKALLSVVSQTFTDYEVIVIDDGSSADYGKVREWIKMHPNINFFSISNSGPAAARNFGISKAKGKFVCFLDDDDEYYPDHLSVLHEGIQSRGGAEAIYKTLPSLSRGGVISRIPYKAPANSMKSVEVIFSSLITPCCVCVARSILDVYRFNTTIPLSEDYELWARIALKYPVFEIPKYTSLSCYHDGNRSVNPEKEIEINKKHIEAFRQICSVPGLKDHLPYQYIAKSLYKRYLWLSEAQKRKKKFLAAAFSRFLSLYYKQKIRG